MGRPPDCNPCCEEPGVACVSGCDDTHSVCYQFSITGVGDEDCGNCDIFNDTFVIERQVAFGEYTCVWEACYDLGTLTGGSNACALGDRFFIQLDMNAAPTPRMIIRKANSDCSSVISGGIFAIYNFDSGSHVCGTDELPFTLDVEDRCTGWPAALTLTPVAC